MWPGSAQTAAVFVGLPLLMALILMAAPLHDAGPPPPVRPPVDAPRIDVLPAAAAVAASVAGEEPVSPAPTRRRAAQSVRRIVSEPVPAVIFEPRPLRRDGPVGNGPRAEAGGMSVVWLARELARECACAVSLATPVPGGRRAAAERPSSTQSP